MNPVTGYDPPPAVPVRLPNGGGGETPENHGHVIPASPASLKLKIDRSDGGKRNSGQPRIVAPFRGIGGGWEPRKPRAVSHFGHLNRSINYDYQWA
jgi:hypothetical protein